MYKKRVNAAQPVALVMPIVVTVLSHCCSACEGKQLLPTLSPASPAPSPLPLSKFMGAILFCLVQAFCKSSAFIFKCSAIAARGDGDGGGDGDPLKCASAATSTLGPQSVRKCSVSWCAGLPFAGGSSPIRRHRLPATSTSADQLTLVCTERKFKVFRAEIIHIEIKKKFSADCMVTLEGKCDQLSKNIICSRLHGHTWILRFLKCDQMQ